MIPNRKWSSDCKWSPKWTGNDLGPQLIPIVDGKDPLKSRGMEWISGMDDECAENLRVTDSKYRESLDRFEKSKTLKLCLKNAFRELSSKMLFRFSKNSTPSRNSQKTKIHLFTSLNMQKISGKLTKFSVIALKQFTILEHGINLA